MTTNDGHNTNVEAEDDAPLVVSQHRRLKPHELELLSRVDQVVTGWIEGRHLLKFPEQIRLDELRLNRKRIRELALFIELTGMGMSYGMVPVPPRRILQLWLRAVLQVPDLRRIARAKVHSPDNVRTVRELAWLVRTTLDGMVWQEAQVPKTT